MVDEVLVADALEDPELLGDVPEGLVVVGLRRQIDRLRETLNRYSVF